MAAHHRLLATRDGRALIRDVVLGLGSNLGDRRAHLARARASISAIAGVREMAVSPIYETPPVGPEQPDYLNAALRVECTLEPEGLLAEIFRIELAGGRERSHVERFGPRTIDIDILWIRGEAVQTPRLEVPHPRLAERAFALVPLYELVPDAVHPVTGLPWTVPPHAFKTSAW